MPIKPLRPCGLPDCPNLTAEKYCQQHKQPDRPSSASRGYNYKWRKASKAFLRKNLLCVKCLSEGRYTAATVVDHIKPHRGDSNLMWDSNNWQALCKPCHDRKTWNEDNNPVYSY